MTGKVENVAHRRGAKRVDRLGVVAHHGEPLAVRLERQQDRGLQPVGVLILIHQHVVEAAADLGGNRRLRHHLRPIKQEIIVIEHVLALLGLDIGGEQPAQLGFQGRAPGKERAEHLVERALGIHGTRIDGEAGALGGEARLGLRKAEIMADEIEQIGGILAVVNGERPIETDLRRVFAQQPGADGVKRAGPGECIRDHCGARAPHIGSHAFDPARHLGGGAAREGQEHHPAGIDAVDDEVRHPVRQRAGLARTGAGNDQQRSGFIERRPAVFHGTALVRIELGEV